MERMNDNEREDAFDSAFGGVDYTLPHEDREKYDLLTRLIEEELQPSDTIERFWAQDYVVLRWQKLRYEEFKCKVITCNRNLAVESILEKINLQEMPAGAEALALAVAKDSAAKLRKKASGAAQVASLLLAYGFDDRAIDAEAFLLSAAVIEALDRRIAAAQSREMKLLREFGSRREFARQARLLSAKVIDLSANTTTAEQAA